MSYPEDDAVETWRQDGALFSIVHVRGSHYCGYVRFPSRPVKEQEYRGILTYVPVHGGITWAKPGEDGTMVYGFDCAHSGDSQDPKLKDMEWLKAECQRLAQAISIAAAYEDNYLLAGDDQAKAEAIDQYHQRLEQENIKFYLYDNFGAMMNAMFGRL